MKVDRAGLHQAADNGQLELFRNRKRGGKRRGAGRPPKGARAGSPHKTRPVHHARYPVHVVLRVAREIGNLRRHDVYHAIREASLITARREDFRIVHLSIQRTHLHMIVEADDKAALAAGMQGFQISAAKRINALGARAAAASASGPAKRRGAVFVDRYHAVPITSPRQARHTLSYVMNNFRKHDEDRSGVARGWNVDWFSSGPMFPGWREDEDDPWLMRHPPSYAPLMVRRPRTWLMHEGWKRSGSISRHAVPSAV